MKIGIHLSSFCSHWDDDVFPYIKTAGVIGYDGVEFPLLNPFEFDAIKAASLLKQEALQATCGTGLNPSIDITSQDAELRKKGTQHLTKCLQICNALSAETLGGVLYAPWGIQKSRKEIGEGIKYSQDILCDLAYLAKEYGVNLALEMLNRYETSLINTVEDGLNFLAPIGQENLGLHFDSFHSHMEEKNIYDALIKAGKHIKHIHFCENDRGIPGTGQVHWDEIKKALHHIEYDHWITLECFTQADCGIGKDVSIWRMIEKDKHDVAKAGYAFIKEFLRS